MWVWMVVVCLYTVCDCVTDGCCDWLQMIKDQTMYQRMDINSFSVIFSGLDDIKSNVTSFRLYHKTVWCMMALGVLPDYQLRVQRTALNIVLKFTNELVTFNHCFYIDMWRRISALPEELISLEPQSPIDCPCVYDWCFPCTDLIGSVWCFRATLGHTPPAEWQNQMCARTGTQYGSVEMYRCAPVVWNVARKKWELMKIKNVEESLRLSSEQLCWR